MIPEYDIYLFDWDGTIANSTAVWLQALRNQFTACGLQPADEQIIAGMGDWRNIRHLGVAEGRVEGFREAARREALENLPTAPLFPSVPEVLLALKQRGKKLAVVTAMHRPIIDAMLAHHGYDSFFDIVVSGSDVENLKPHPAALLLALEKLGRTTNQTVLMLGDADRDILAAHAAKVDSLLYFPDVHHTFHDFEVVKKHAPTYIIHDWKELM